MNSQSVVSDLVILIWQRFRGFSNNDIEKTLVREGWGIGEVQEAIAVYRSTRQFI
ncbi:MAG: hypothetical protein AAGF27_01305 [Pseudomonadota bacterium]